MEERGRPTVMTEEVVRKIEEGATKGFNDSECCLYAGISRSAFYDYVKANPDFSDKIDNLRNHPKIRAKQVINAHLEQGDENTAKWYLERKSKDEFSTKSEVENSGNIEISIVKYEA